MRTFIPLETGVGTPVVVVVVTESFLVPLALLTLGFDPGKGVGIRNPGLVLDFEGFRILGLTVVASTVSPGVAVAGALVAVAPAAPSPANGAFVKVTDGSAEDKDEEAQDTSDGSGGRPNGK